MSTGPGRTVWLASYPKSGNTWVRAIVTALGRHPQLFGVDGLSSGAQPHHVGMALSAYGIDPRWLTPDENDQVRSSLAIMMGRGDAGSVPVLRKTHELYRPGSPGREPFPLAATRAAILVVRDPRDVACSYAAFFGISLDEAIAAMARESGEPEPHPARAQTAQPWGTWTTHAESWLDDSVPFPVHLVRYEDLIDDAVATLTPVFAAVGLDCTDAQLRAAVDLASFDALRRSEEERGFRGTHHRTQRFFRRGIAGGWRQDLAPEQVTAIEAAHGPVMQRLGYAAEQDASPAALSLPAHLGIRVREGALPDALPGSTSPRPWIQATPTAALVRFRGRAGLLVEHGTDVTVDRGTRGADEVGWMVQGWAVTLAMLQRGLL
ncbi:MAG: Sulfotransfer 1 protein, partial [Actinomycetota bacterium]|nr:Sulfotransfer 1 protein [Actinomycetota bacterium]